MRMIYGLVLLALLGAPCFAADKTRVSATISSDDSAAAQKIAAAVNAELAKAIDVEIVDKLPQAKLILYANRDVNNKNPNGWSIAIAHVSNVETYYLASKLLQSEQSDAAAAKPMLAQMVNEQGFLTHLSVAHLDELSDAAVAALARSVVPTFLAKIPRAK